MQIKILDSTVLLEGAQDLLPEGPNVTVYDVVGEIKSGKASIELDRMMRSGLEIIEPEDRFVLLVKKIQEKTKDRISKADTKVIALALQFRERGKDVAVVSDDYAVQNICKRENINFIPLSKKGIRREFEWAAKCRACGAPMEGDECPVCGGKDKKFNPKQPRK